ncbi:hypothetical protein [Nocardia sp. NPDC050710]|uniref:preATP grasp domain-containing protein n=1 Tax=Nocardia sp. NPDC050710 TaxID=3157220 RepID=UPI0033CCBE43
MRVLIANDIDENLFLRKDTRAWSQRVFWLGEPGDLVIVPDTPDIAFVEHVGLVRQKDLSTVRVSVAPPGKYGTKMIDMSALCNPGYIDTLRTMLPSDDSVEIVLLFPSIAAARFVEALGRSATIEGQEFFRQGGANLSNSKAAFRALATGVVPIADGDVCFTREEAHCAILDLLASGRRVLIKKVQAGGGVGNELLSVDSPLPSHIGVLTARRIPDHSKQSVQDYLDERWQWASMDGRLPVVVEEFHDVRASFAIEYHLTDSGITLLGTSRLDYENNRICREIFGDMPSSQRSSAEFRHGGESLAVKYRHLGYRGYICFDAIVTEAGQVLFTEANARTATGTHVNVAFQQFLAGATPSRLAQVASDRGWGALSTAAFLRAVRDHHLDFDPDTGHGIVMMTPPLSDRPGGGFMYLIGSADEAGAAVYQEKLLKCVPRAERETAPATS